jgi:lambda family phage portal protein
MNFAPLKALSALFDSPARKPATVAQRSYDGGGSGRRWVGFADQPSAASAALASAGTLARRARGLVANNAHATSAAEAWVSALVGTGLKVQSSRPGLAEEFESWTDDADADELTDLYGQQAGGARSMVINGEAFALIMPDGRIRLLDPEQVDRNITRNTAGNGKIVQGVEFDAAGRRVAYHIRRDQPGMPFPVSYETVRVPAAQVLHMFKPIFPGQVRGVSWFAPVLLRLADYDRSMDAQLQRQLVAALFAGFVTEPNGTAPFDGEQNGSALQATLEPGTMQLLRPGQAIEFSQPAGIGAEAIDFLKITRDEIAAGLGIPSHVLSGDLSRANYSSLRAGLIDWRRRVEAIQHGVVVFQFCRPIWRNWLLLRALSGAPDMPGYFRDQRPYEAARWITPRFDWVDPLKDAEAEIAAIGAGLMSRRQAVAARGEDIERLDAEIAADNARASALGLSFEQRPRQTERLPA